MVDGYSKTISADFSKKALKLWNDLSDYEFTHDIFKNLNLDSFSIKRLFGCRTTRK